MSSTIHRPPRRKEWVSHVSERLLRGYPNEPGILLTNYSGPFLKLESRAVGAWIEGRSDSWTLNVKGALASLNITEHRWQMAAGQLIQFGYLDRIRLAGGRGKAGWRFTWVELGVEFELAKIFEHEKFRPENFRLEKFGLEKLEPLLPQSKKNKEEKV